MLSAEPLKWRANWLPHTIIVGALVAAAFGADTLVNDSHGRNAVGQWLITNDSPVSGVLPESVDAELAPLIVLDPGHGGPTKPGEERSRIDPASGLHDGDYMNDPEVYEVYDVAMSVKAKLEAAHYRVLVTKDSALDITDTYLRDRANLAENNHADLAVSIHTSHNTSSSMREIYDQFVGGWRGDQDASKPGHVFNNQATAAASQAAALQIEKAREAAEGMDVVITKNNFDGRAPIEPGNIPLVCLWAPDVPWVYNEVGVPGEQKMSDADIEAYATGLANGIMAAVPNPTT